MWGSRAFPLIGFFNVTFHTPLAKVKKGREFSQSPPFYSDLGGAKSGEEGEKTRPSPYSHTRTLLPIIRSSAEKLFKVTSVLKAREPVSPSGSIWTWVFTPFCTSRI